MAWSIIYEGYSKRPLSQRKIELVAAHVRKWNQNDEWGGENYAPEVQQTPPKVKPNERQLVIWGSTAPDGTLEEVVLQTGRILSALTELKQLLPQVEWEIIAGEEKVMWDKERQKFVIPGMQHDSLVELPAEQRTAAANETETPSGERLNALVEQLISDEQKRSDEAKQQLIATADEQSVIFLVEYATTTSSRTSWDKIVEVLRSIEAKMASKGIRTFIFSAKNASKKIQGVWMLLEVEREAALDCAIQLLYETKPALVEGGIGIFGAIYRANAWNLNPEHVYFSIPHIIEKLDDKNEKINTFAEEVLRTAKEPYASQIAAHLKPNISTDLS
ncbi:hypothetical protein HYR99_39860 [Candidatus Poribacteria bacterium]|nr:hypothetical protein [Candidatus Poribacteria bacterium]